MKTLIDLITEQVTNAFTSQGYDAKYGKVTLSNRPDWSVSSNTRQQR